MGQQNIKWIKFFKILIFNFIVHDTLAKDNAEILHYHIHTKQCTDINYQKPILWTQCPQNSHLYKLLNLFTLTIIIVWLTNPSLCDEVKRLFFHNLYYSKHNVTNTRIFYMLFDIQGYRDHSHLIDQEIPISSVPF